MNAKQERLYQSFRRVQGWISAHPELTGAAGSAPGTGTPMTTQVAALDTIVQQVGAAASAQDTHVRAASSSAAETKRLRTELVTHQMRPIATIAKMAIPDVVRVSEALRMPAKKIRAEGLIAAAESMAVLGEKNQDPLVTGGLSVNFVAQLRSVAAAYKQAIDTRGQAVVSRKGATQGLNTQLATGRKVVETLSVIVRQQLRQDPVALAEWHQAKRVTIKGAQSRSPVAAPTVGAPSAASTPVAVAAAPIGLTASAVVTAAEQQHQTA